MSTDRDELAETQTFGHGGIKFTTYPASGRVAVEVAATNAVMDLTELFNFVDRIRKPRTITTVEELDALPGESVIQDASGIPYELDYTVGNPADKWWIATGMTEHLEHRHIELPATVLYEPLP